MFFPTIARLSEELLVRIPTVKKNLINCGDIPYISAFINFLYSNYFRIRKFLKAILLY